MRNGKHPASFIAVLFLIVHPAATGQSIPDNDAPTQEPRASQRLTLDDAVRIALSNHPSLARTREAIMAANARTEQAASGYFPQVSASGFAKQGLSGASGALGLRGLVTSPLFRDIGASSAIIQNLYDFGRTTHQVRASRWLAASLQHTLQAQEALVTLNVQRVFYSVLEQGRLIGVAENILDQRNLAVKQASAFYQAELGSKVDLTLAQLAVANANLGLVRERDMQLTARAELDEALGSAGGISYEPVEPHIALKDAPSMEPILSESLRRPEILALEARIKGEEEMLARARSNRWPRLTGLFSGGWVRFSELSPGKLLLGSFGIDLPLFTGGRIENEIVEARAAIAQAQAEREELAHRIQAQVRGAIFELDTSREMVRTSEQSIDQAREALRLAQARYQAQLGSFVELSAAQAAADTAEAQNAQAKYRYKMSEAALDYAAGRRYAPNSVLPP